jgi:hypothetical protein
MDLFMEDIRIINLVKCKTCKKMIAIMGYLCNSTNQSPHVLHELRVFRSFLLKSCEGRTNTFETKYALLIKEL